MLGERHSRADVRHEVGSAVVEALCRAERAQERVVVTGRDRKDVGKARKAQCLDEELARRACTVYEYRRGDVHSRPIGDDGWRDQRDRNGEGESWAAKGSVHGSGVIVWHRGRFMQRERLRDLVAAALRR